jgi:UDP-N-acetylmuramyl pentapeptide phosphotransferase/UDP-N-acetylglucosamine-1-phosphate transferase
LNAGVTISIWPALAIAALGAAVLCAVLIMLLMPLLARYALARPNARSSHVAPTPQGGGIAVVVALVTITLPTVLLIDQAQFGQLAILLVTAAGLAVVGMFDDIRTIEVLPRLALQFLAVALLVLLLPSDIHVIPPVPLWLERAALVVAGVWLINLVNFMDGIDWMTVMEVSAICIGLLLLAWLGALPRTPTVVAIVLLGAIIGFAPFNRPVAKLFLGDVGSLPIGLILLWLLVQLAAGGHIAAALLLPLYYLGDASTTLLLRLKRGERVTQAHRAHFYQRATAFGLSVMAVNARVAGVNVVLIGLALVSVWMHSTAVDLALLAAGCIAVGWFLHHLAADRRTN